MFCSASEDIPDSDEIRSFLKSLREARQSKIMTGLSAVNSEHLNVSLNQFSAIYLLTLSLSLSLQMTNISLGEVTELRDFLTTAQNHLRSIERAAEPDEGDTVGQENSSNQFTYSFQPQDTAATTGTGLARAQVETSSLNNDNMNLF